MMNPLILSAFLLISGMLFALFIKSEVQLRLSSINRLYDLTLFPILFAIAIIGSLLLMPVKAEAAPQVINALTENRGDWRNYYRDKFFADMHSLALMDSLKAVESQDPLIKEAIRLRLEDKWKESIDTLTGLIADANVKNKEEVAYVLGLIYESLAFFPEAMGNYDRLEFKKGDVRGDFYYKTILRKSYVKFITGLKYNKLLAMIDADGGFFKVFNNSNDEADWRDALAGHGVMLYFFGAHDHASEMFLKVKEYGPLKTDILFAQAENYMNMGLHQEARVAFQDMIPIFKDTERTDLLSYIFLRLGDIANIRNEKDNAVAFYKLITPKLEQGEKVVFNDPYIIQAMALGEFLMKDEKNNEAIAIFNLLTTGPMPIGLDLRESIALNLVLLHHGEEHELKAFDLAKQFLLLYPENPYIQEIKSIVDNTIFKFIAQVYEGQNLTNVLYYYYENLRYVNEKRTLMIVAKVFLDLGFPDDAFAVFTKLWNRYTDHSDIELLTGLARSQAMLSKFKDSSMHLTRARPKDRLAREQVALAWRFLGDENYRRDDKKGALRAYGKSRATLFDVSMELRYGALFTSLGRAKEALSVYKTLLKRSLIDESKAGAYYGTAQAYVTLGNWRKAVINYQFALKLTKKKIKGEINYKIAEASFAMGNNTLALKAWKESERVDEQGYYKRLSKGRIKEVLIWEQARM